jgi:hypothetical protein
MARSGVSGNLVTRPIAMSAVAVAGVGGEAVVVSVALASTSVTFREKFCPNFTFSPKRLGSRPTVR